MLFDGETVKKLENEFGVDEQTKVLELIKRKGDIFQFISSAESSHKL